MELAPICLNLLYTNTLPHYFCSRKILPCELIHTPLNSYTLTSPTLFDFFFFFNDDLLVLVKAGKAWSNFIWEETEKGDCIDIARIKMAF